MSEALNRVTVRRCPDYTSTNLTLAVEELLSDLEPLPLPQGSRVLLKPNCLSAHHGPDHPINTRVEVVEAVGRAFLNYHRAGKGREYRSPLKYFSVFLTFSRIYSINVLTKTNFNFNFQIYGYA